VYLSASLEVRDALASLPAKFIDSNERKDWQELNLEREKAGLQPVTWDEYHNLNVSVTESAYRGAQALDGLVPHPERLRQSMCQGLALGIKGLLGGGGIATLPALGKNQAKFLENIPRTQPALL
jgi:hypothetical protein